MKYFLLEGFEFLFIVYFEKKILFELRLEIISHKQKK